MARGVPVYVMGPSGSGKDTILARSRTELAGGAPVAFAHRYITRPAASGGENHVALSEAEFESRLTRGLFAMDWQSHGLRYGLGREIELWLEAGLCVVMNGSREYLPTARRRCPGLLPVLVRVDQGVLRARLAARGREDSFEIERRLERACRFSVEGADVTVIDNSGAIEESVAEFSRFLKRTWRNARRDAEALEGFPKIKGFGLPRPFSKRA